jgi:hypothetical protein
VTEHHRFPAPWRAEDNGACLIIRDHNGQPNLLTRYEARPIAANNAKLPNLLRQERNANPRMFYFQNV